MTRHRKVFALVAALLLGAPGPAFAWSNHGLLTYWTFKDTAEVAAAPDVQAEPLDAFLRDQEQAIANLLEAQEIWARANVPTYPPRPDELAFKVDALRDDAARRKAFAEALRIAPNTRFALFTQNLPGFSRSGAKTMPFAEVSTLREPAFSMMRFFRLEPGETVPALLVLASSSDEPDFGVDINCWDDSPSEWGKRYKFGKLPFGNPALDFATQAPFHMGFFHQSWLIYKAAPFVARTYPELRAHQFIGLARLAFRTGHPYWGWRFAGMAMHYVQDLAQPYHASILPGVSTLRMIATNTVAMVGWKGPKDAMVVLASNRHLAFERYEALLIYRDTAAGGKSPLIQALQAKARDGVYPKWSDLYLRDVVTQEAFDFGEALSTALLAAFPPKYVSDPSYDFGASGGSGALISEVAERTPEQRAEIEGAVVELMGHFGAHSRNLVRALGSTKERND
ncbi:MAG: hypothetical protein KDJ44_10025 [Rhodoblastus sp.]|nr:hypothetical protein [Rhodoblastus sp.]